MSDRTACAANFGYETIFSSTQEGVRRKQIATQVTIPEDGFLISITAYVVPNTRDINYAIYTDVAGEPDTLLAETAVVRSNESETWLTISLPSTAISAGTYWLALSFEDNSQKYYYDGTGGETRYKDYWATQNGYLATWGASDDSYTRRISIYATYSTSPPLNFGYATVFGSSQNSVRRKQIGTQVTLTEDADVTSITAYVGGKKDMDIRYALYSDSGGEPDSLLAETTVEQQSVDSMEWFTIDLPVTSVSAGTYWLALSFEDNNQKYQYDDTGGETRYKDHRATQDGYLVTWGASDASNTRRISIYATYYPTNGGSPSIVSWQEVEPQ